MSVHDSETVEDIRPALMAGKYFVHSSVELKYEFGAASHAGLKRSENQDHYVGLRRTRGQQLLLTNDDSPQEHGNYLRARLLQQQLKSAEKE